MEHRRRYLAWLTGAVAGLLLLLYSRTILLGIAGVVEILRPFLLGIIFAFILSQPHALFCGFYERKLHVKGKTAHILAIVTVYLLLAAAVALLIGLVLPQLFRSLQVFAQNAESYLAGVQRELDRLTGQLHLTGIDLSSVLALIQAGLGQLDDGMVPKILSVTGTMLRSAASAAIAFAFSVYLLAGKQRILSQADRILRAYLPADGYDHIRYVLEIIAEVFRNYIIGQSTEAVILGSLCFAGMLLLRLNYAGMVSVIVAFTALIPILGAYLGGAAAVILLLMVSPMKALIFLLFFLLLQQIENNVIYPRVVGKRIGLPGIWVLLAITVGGKLGGIVGMLFGVPSATIAYILLRNSVRTRERNKK